MKENVFYDSPLKEVRLMPMSTTDDEYSHDYCVKIVLDGMLEEFNRCLNAYDTKLLISRLINMNESFKKTREEEVPF